MNADTILIIWGTCLAFAVVFVLVAAIRGNEKLRDEPEWLPKDMDEDVICGIDTGAPLVTITDFAPGPDQAFDLDEVRRCADVIDHVRKIQLKQSGDLPEGLSDFEVGEAPDEYDIAHKNLVDNPLVRKYFELDTKPAGLPGLAGLKLRNRGKVKLIIEATDMTKNPNKEGTDGETKLHEE